MSDSPQETPSRYSQSHSELSSLRANRSQNIYPQRFTNNLPSRPPSQSSHRSNNSYSESKQQRNLSNSSEMERNKMQAGLDRGYDEYDGLQGSDLEEDSTIEIEAGPIPGKHFDPSPPLNNRYQPRMNDSNSNSSQYQDKNSNNYKLQSSPFVGIANIESPVRTFGYNATNLRGPPSPQKHSKSFQKQPIPNFASTSTRPHNPPVEADQHDEDTIPFINLTVPKASMSMSAKKQIFRNKIGSTKPRIDLINGRERDDRIEAVATLPADMTRMTHKLTRDRFDEFEESDQYQSSESETQTESDRQSPSQFIPSPRLDSIRHDSSSPLLRPSPTRASTIRSSPLHQSAERGARRNQNDQDLMERNATETPQVERRLNALEAENRRIAEDSANTIRQLQSDGDAKVQEVKRLESLCYNLETSLKRVEQNSREQHSIQAELKSFHKDLEFIKSEIEKIHLTLRDFVAGSNQDYKLWKESQAKDLEEKRREIVLEAQERGQRNVSVEETRNEPVAPSRLTSENLQRRGEESNTPRKNNHSRSSSSVGSSARTARVISSLQRVQQEQQAQQELDTGRARVATPTTAKENEAPNRQSAEIKSPRTRPQVKTAITTEALPDRARSRRQSVAPVPSRVRASPTPAPLSTPVPIIILEEESQFEEDFNAVESQEEEKSVEQDEQSFMRGRVQDFIENLPAFRESIEFEEVINSTVETRRKFQELSERVKNAWDNFELAGKKFSLSTNLHLKGNPLHEEFVKLSQLQELSQKAYNRVGLQLKGHYKELTNFYDSRREPRAPSQRREEGII